MFEFLIYLATMTGVYGILALSLNLQFGFTGLVNLGHIVFFMLGAYTSAILVMLVGLPFPVGVLGGIVVAGAFGGLMALPTAHLQQDYWAISTLAAAEIVRIVILNTELAGPYVGASFGISGIPQPWRDAFASPAAYGIFYLVLVAVAVVACFLFVRWLPMQLHSRGRRGAIGAGQGPAQPAHPRDDRRRCARRARRRAVRALQRFYRAALLSTAGDVHHLGDGDPRRCRQSPGRAHRRGHRAGAVQLDPLPRRLYSSIRR